MITYKTKLRIFPAIFCLLISCVIVLLRFCAFGQAVYADENDLDRYSDVLEDLSKDSEFNANEYLSCAEDYSIRVIQIAESECKELFVYTYQACQKTTPLTATEINMSLTNKMGISVNYTDGLSSDDRPSLYGLTLLNENGVFCKYKVNGFKVSDDMVRYYNIASIYREWIKGIDSETVEDNTKNAVAFNVGKCFKATTDENGKVIYLHEDLETIQIINPVAGYLEFYDGFKFCPTWCDSHYIAFSTDKKIDSLMEADVSYVRQDMYVSNSVGMVTTPSSARPVGDPVKATVTLYGDQKGGNAADGFLGKKYEWDRIQTVDEFISDEQNDLTDTAKEKLTGQQWVLRFLETERGQENGFMEIKRYWSEVSEVTILRLKFVFDRKMYNLGAVSDKVTEGPAPDNKNTNELEDLWTWLVRVTGIPKWVWILFFVLIVLAIALPILSVFFPVIGQALLWIVKAIGKAFAWLFKCLWRLISAPFKWIAGKIKKE